MKKQILVAMVTLFIASTAAAQSLPAWDQLTPAQRDALSAPVKERWNASPEHRAKMLERATKWSSMTPEQRALAAKGRSKFHKMSPEAQNATRAVFYKAQSFKDKTERKTFLDGLRKMTPEQRAAWVKANPAPADFKMEPRGRGGKHHRGAPMKRQFKDASAPAPTSN